MQYRVWRLRFRRSLRKGQKHVEEFGSQAEEQLEQQFFQKLSKLATVKRFITLWILFFVVLGSIVIWQLYSLSGYYQSVQAVPGGIYTEGMLGDFTTANPLFASNDVDSSVARLVFAGLLTYNNKNQLVGDLAKGWSVNQKGTVYTVELKPNLTWQDGKPLTAEDVVFTYQVIQNPDARSPLAPGWQSVNIAAHGPTTVTFTLPNPLASFPYELTNGIVPKHLLGNTSMADIRSADFNTVNPVGSGPFKWKTLEVSGSTPQTRQEQIALIPNPQYVRGAPKLSNFIVHAFHSQDQLVASYKRQELTAIAGLPELPTALQKIKTVHQTSSLLTAANMVFFKTAQGPLSDVHVRQALVLAADRQTIIKSLGYATRPVTEPLLEGQLGYDPQYAQASFNAESAKSQLDAAGWKQSANGYRSKDNQMLKFTLFTANDGEDQQVAKQLQAQWQTIGADVTVNAQSADDLQQTISNHAYDALLHGIAIGVDPDVFVYWDSAQADVRLANRPNLSEYKSTVVDQALEAGRTRLDPTLRAVKYRPFLQTWQQDAPALGLYQPRYLYITRQPVYGMQAHALNSGTDRFNNVQDWEIAQAAVTNH